MPKILINEEDFTTPGTPDGYANYTVLIPGFMGDGDGTTVKPDANGVYEFHSYQDFEDTIGRVEPHYEADNTNISHYGNQMAYELLKLGYPVLYLPINKNNLVATLTNAATWEIFRDKATYDFRFVHHGLLESTEPAVLTKLQNEADNLIETLQLLHNEEVIVFDKNALTVTVGGSAYEIGQSPDQRFEEVYTSEQAYSALLESLNSDESQLEDDNLKDAEGNYYTSGHDAAVAVLQKLQDTIIEKDACVAESVINAVNTNIANLAMYTADDAVGIPGRGDCIALIELDENSYTNTASAAKPEIQIRDAIQRLSTAMGDMAGCGKYCALTVPSVYYNDGRKFPGGFHYLSCFINSLRQGFAEWYAAAGYTRGVSSYVIDHTSVKLGEIAINALEPRQKQVDGQIACNVIANFRGSYYLWGNRTAHPLNDSDLTASSFLNIRQLCTTIKKQLYVACRRFTFDPNSDTLWFNFVNAIKPTLEAMKADQGVRDYKIMKITTDKKATLKAKIRIIPIEAVEDFDLTVSLEDSFGETAAVVTE